MIERIAIYGSVVAEALGFYVVSELIASTYDDPRHTAGGWAFALTGLVAFLLPRILEWFAFSRRVSNVLFILTAYVVIYGVIRIEFAGDFAIWDLSWIREFADNSDAAQGAGAHALFATVLLIAVWAREAARSFNDVELEMLPRSLGSFFAVVTIVAVLGALTTRSGEVGRAAAAFYAVALLSLACSQLAQSGSSIGEFRAGGITAVLFIGTIAVAAGGLILTLVLFGLLGPIIGPPLRASIEFVLTILLTPPAWLLTKFFEWAFHGLELPATEQPPPRGPGGQPEPSEGGERSFSDYAAMGFRILLLAVIIAIVVAIIIYVARLHRRARSRTDQPPVSSTIGNIRDDLRDLWGALRHGRSRSAPPGPAEGAARLYREVLQRADAAGHPRPPGRTPAEFRPELTETFQKPVTDEITAAFEQARYAGREPDAATLAELEQRWRAT